MRKPLVWSLAVALTLSTVSGAQSPAFGVRGGLNAATFGGRRVVDSDYRLGFTVGGYAAFPITSTLAIQPEINFSQRGAKRAAYDYSDMPADGDAPPMGAYVNAKTTLDYLEIPLLLRLGPSLAGSAIRPIFFVGPTVEFLLHASEVYDTDYRDHMRSADAGFIVGGGAEFGRLSLDARYTLGLSPIDKKYNATFGTVAGGIKNRAFTVAAGVRLF
jgi:hypothetical protein